MSEIYQTINSIADNKLAVFVLSGILGFLVNFFYSLYGFKWVNNINQKIIALIMAPSMTVIAWTIAGNLGLSLGMIGALSIVRFRTPIKSSLELIIYFIYIVIGISITVAPRSTPFTTPLTPSTTSSTAATEGSEMIITSLFFEASAGVRAVFTPSFCARPTSISHATTS